MLFRSLPSAELLRECFDYNAGEGVLLWRNRPQEHFLTAAKGCQWNGRYAGRRAGCLNSHGRRIVAIRFLDLHYRLYSTRIIWKLQTGREPAQQIDHVNNDRSDDRWVNLREATHSENLANRPGWRRGLKGVGFSSRRGRWFARIRMDGACYHVGSYLTEEEAHAAYAAAAEKLHGVFRNTASSAVEEVERLADPL